ncbi:MAG: helix-turn-helix domain-containing protein [Stellaceae bacterium]
MSPTHLHIIVDNLLRSDRLTLSCGYAQAGRAKRQASGERRGPTQEKFAEISGFSQQYISSLERGRRNPTVLTIYEWAAALGLSHIDFLRPDKEG